MNKSNYIAPKAEFICISPDKDILDFSHDFGTEFPASYGEEE